MSELPPIRRSVRVSWDPPTAFRRFTEGFGAWWPWQTHSIGGKRIKRLVFEGRVDGLIFEEHLDGRRFQWGRILEYDSPRRLKFTWHPSRDFDTAQEIEVRFEPEGSGTRVLLVADKWEKWGKNAHRARKGYDIGWGYVLNVWADRRTASMALMDGIGLIVRGIELARGGTRGNIARSKGEIAPVTADTAL